MERDWAAPGTWKVMTQAKCELKIKIYSQHIWISPEYTRVSQIPQAGFTCLCQAENHKLGNGGAF